MPLTRKEFLDIAGPGAMGVFAYSTFATPGCCEEKTPIPSPGGSPESEDPFSYMANALAFGGQVVEPRADLLEAQGATVLSPAGGHGSAHVENYRYGQVDGPVGGPVEERKYRQIVSIDSAHSEVIGSRNNVEKANETVASVTMEGVDIGGVVKADKIVARLTSIRKPGTKEPPIRHVDSEIVNLRVDGKGVTLTPVKDLLHKHHTFWSVVNYCVENQKQGAFGSAQQHLSTMHKSNQRAAPEPPPDVVVRLSVFERLSERGCKAQPWECCIEVPGFRISLGELEITPFSRRLTMMRIKAGPNLGGDFVMACVQGDGRDL